VPTVASAVNVDEVALPFASVISVSVFVPFANVPDGAAAGAGAVNVTDAPLTRFPSSSVTVATRGFANAVLTVALCGVPLVATIKDGGADVFVRLKSAPAAGRVVAATL
jgi:hypothetical protein